MPGAGRVGDTGQGTCPNHDSPQDYTTSIESGADTVKINGQPAAIVGSPGCATCGHPTTASVGSDTVKINGQPAHRTGDTGSNFGPYNLLVGSTDVNIG